MLPTYQQGPSAGVASPTPPAQPSRRSKKRRLAAERQPPPGGNSQLHLYNLVNSSVDAPVGQSASWMSWSAFTALLHITSNSNASSLLPCTPLAPSAKPCPEHCKLSSGR
eukprot:4142660-Amphidinium_carterae.2